jgi:hypothetical protein
MRIDASETVHPESSDPVDEWGVRHIVQCADCRTGFPEVANLGDQCSDEPLTLELQEDGSYYAPVAGVYRLPIPRADRSK